MEAIRCNDRLPEAGEEVLIWEIEAGWRLAWLVIGKTVEGHQYPSRFENCEDLFFLHNVSHWMPLPPEPKL